VYDIHLKDVSVVAKNGKPIEVGRGGLDIASVLKALIAIKFTGNVGFEYEKDAQDPALGLAESVGYVRGILKGL
jgi:inosose dehydratase